MKTDDPKFIDLALKAIAAKATAAEQEELKTLLAKPELAEEFKQMRADAAFAKEVLPLMGEAPATTPPLTDFERSQLKRVAESRSRKAEPKPSNTWWSWQWILGVAGAAAVLVLVVTMGLPTSHRTIQLAMLDSIGTTRGTNDINATLLPALQENFGQTNVISYTESAQLNTWLKDWPNAKTVKIVYDRDNGEVRVVYRDNGNKIISTTFPVMKEADLPTVLKKAADCLK